MEDNSKLNAENVVLKYKVWLSTAEGDGILGGGKMKLLKSISEEGSLKSASEKLGISYRKAWGDLKSAEERLGFKLLVRSRGGKDGGKSDISEKGKNLIQAYEILNIKIGNTVDGALGDFLKKINS